ncbi:MAG: hypothetical protein M1834_002228 [Cirrosporium novae-zelandiae]|nr:MAG: hypothetical protein M1834_002228 [Cirrosporium novae-zelandiae]
MKTSILTTVTLIGAAFASPVVRSRPLAAREGCPAELQANYLFPHLIVPISASNPDTAYGTVYSPEFTPNDFCTIFNFDIPADAEGKNCSLEFFFPTQSQLQTSSYTFSGPGTFVFNSYEQGTGATVDTTYNTQPAAGEHGSFPPLTMTPGNAYVLDTAPCQLLNGQSTLVSGSTCTNDTTFTYFQDSGECPIGLYVGITG